MKRPAPERMMRATGSVTACGAQLVFENQRDVLSAERERFLVEAVDFVAHRVGLRSEAGSVGRGFGEGAVDAVRLARGDGKINGELVAIGRESFGDGTRAAAEDRLRAF